MNAQICQRYADYMKRQDVSWIFCICCALFVIGMGLTFQAPWVDWDASDYINVAENIVHGKGVVSGWESDTIHKFWPLTVWPPLYPILIAVLVLVGFSSVNAAMWVQILSLTGIVVVSFHLGKETDSPLVGYLSALVILLMSTLWEMARMALTEVPYIFFSIIGLYFLIRYLKSGTYWFLLFAALLCGTGAVTRYMGVTLIFTGLFILVIQPWKKPVSQLKQIGLFGIISSLPLCLVFIRNISNTGHFSGADRGGGSGNIAGVAHDMAQILISDLTPFKPLGNLGASNGIFAITCIILVIVAALLLYGVYQSDKRKFILNIWKFISDKRVIISYILIYAVSLFVLEIGMGDIATVQTRYLLPVYPFVIILVLSFMRGACGCMKPSSYRVMSGALCTILILGFLSGQVFSTIPIMSDKGGRSYTDPSWYDEPIEEYQWVMQNIPHGAEIFSNNPRAMQLHTSRAIPTLPEQGNGETARKLLTKLHPGQMIVSLNGKKSNDQYMNAGEFFSYNKDFTSPAVFKQVFSTRDAEVYQVVSPAS
nr:glycosyltransferase family 39 protein [uncultured Methanospirillum sp.]